MQGAADEDEQSEGKNGLARLMCRSGSRDLREELRGHDNPCDSGTPGDPRRHARIGASALLAEVFAPRSLLGFHQQDRHDAQRRHEHDEDQRDELAAPPVADDQVQQQSRER